MHQKKPAPFGAGKKQKVPSSDKRLKWYKIRWLKQLSESQRYAGALVFQFVLKNFDCLQQDLLLVGKKSKKSSRSCHFSKKGDFSLQDIDSVIFSWFQMADGQKFMSELNGKIFK